MAVPAPQAPPEPTYETDWIEVVEPVKPQEGNRVTHLEWHRQHPSDNGEAMLAPGKVVLVAITPPIAALLQRGILKRADPPARVFAETPWVAVPDVAPREFPPVPQATAARHRGVAHHPQVVQPVEMEAPITHPDAPESEAAGRKK